MCVIFAYLYQDKEEDPLLFPQLFLSSHQEE
jgi:hypothetical protein